MKRANITGKEVNWNQLFYFCEVATHGSLKAAGQKLGLSPSTLSEHIAQLEEDLRLQLFHRHHRKLELTGEGARLFQQAKQMFEDGLRMLDVLSPLPLGHYPVTIGLVPGFSLPLGYELIHQFMKAYPKGRLRLEHASHEELERGLSESRFDFGVSHRMPERKDLQAQLISMANLGFYVCADLPGNRLDLLLEKMPLLLCGDAASRGLLEKYLEKHDLAPVSVATSDYPGLVIDLCLRGEGIAVLGQARADTMRDPRLDGLRMLRRPGPLEKLEEPLFALWPLAGENSAAVQELRRIFSGKEEV